MGADPAVIGPWIAETQAKKVTAQAEIRTATGRRQMSRDDIAAIVAALADLAQVVCEADPADKADIYAQLNLTLTYQPGQRLVEATVKPGLNMRKGFVSEGRHRPYVHDRHCPDHEVFAWCGRCPMSGGDWGIRWSAAVAMLGVAAVAAVPGELPSCCAGRQRLRSYPTRR